MIIKTLLRYLTIVFVLIALMGVAHLGMSLLGGGNAGRASVATTDLGQRPDARAGRVGRGGRGGGGGHILGSLLVVGVIGTAVAQVAQRTRRQRRTLITA